MDGVKKICIKKGTEKAALFSTVTMIKASDASPGAHTFFAHLPQ
jgi:hypothetical protein